MSANITFCFIVHGQNYLIITDSFEQSEKQCLLILSNYLKLKKSVYSTHGYTNFFDSKHRLY